MLCGVLYLAAKYFQFCRHRHTILKQNLNSSRNRQIFLWFEENGHTSNPIETEAASIGSQSTSTPHNFGWVIADGEYYRRAIRCHQHSNHYTSRSRDCLVNTTLHRATCDRIYNTSDCFRILRCLSNYLT